MADLDTRASGTPLPRRRGPVVAPLVLALACAVPVAPEVWNAWVGDDPTDLGRAGSLAMMLGFVVVPLLLAGLFAGHRFHVSHEAVSWALLGRVRRTVRFDRVESVVVGKELFRRPFRFSRDDVVAVLAAFPEGRRGVRVSTTFVRDVRPLLDRLQEEVARRPEILAAEQRPAFEALVARAPARAGR